MENLCNNSKEKLWRYIYRWNPFISGNFECPDFPFIIFKILASFVLLLVLEVLMPFSSFFDLLYEKNGELIYVHYNYYISIVWSLNFVFTLLMVGPIWNKKFIKFHKWDRFFVCFIVSAGIFLSVNNCVNRGDLFIFNNFYQFFYQFVYVVFVKIYLLFQIVYFTKILLKNRVRKIFHWYSIRQIIGIDDIKGINQRTGNYELYESDRNLNLFQIKIRFLINIIILLVLFISLINSVGSFAEYQSSIKSAYHVQNYSDKLLNYSIISLGIGWVILIFPFKGNIYPIQAQIDCASYVISASIIFPLAIILSAKKIVFESFFKGEFLYFYDIKYIIFGYVIIFSVMFYRFSFYLNKIINKKYD